MAEVCKRQGISEQTWYRWKKKFGQMNVPDVRRLRELEKENTRLKRIVAERPGSAVRLLLRWSDIRTDRVERYLAEQRSGANGVHPKVIQEIMRHGDINLTMTRYGHTLRGQTAEAVRKLPNLSLASGVPQEAVATGTDGTIANGCEQLTPELTPQLTPTAFPTCRGLSTNDTAESERPSTARNHKCFCSGELGVNGTGLSSHVIDEKQLRPEGLGPPTIGSEDRGSIQLSYGRNS